MTPLLLTPAQAAKYTGLTIDRLYQLRRDGGGPPYIREGHRTLFYRDSDLRAWVEAQQAVGSMAEEAMRDAS